MSDTDTAEPITAASTEVEPSEDADVVDTPTTDVEDVDEDRDDDAETFPRSYVEELRRENARYRERAHSADDTYAKRLHIELVRATGKLADPTDLEFTEDHLDDPTPFSPPSTTCWPASRTLRPGGLPAK